MEVYSGFRFPETFLHRFTNKGRNGLKNDEMQEELP